MELSVVLSSPALARALAQPGGCPQAASSWPLPAPSVFRARGLRATPPSPASQPWFLAPSTLGQPGSPHSPSWGRGPAVVCVQQRAGPPLSGCSGHSVEGVNLGGQPALPQSPLPGRNLPIEAPQPGSTVAWTLPASPRARLLEGHPDFPAEAHLPVLAVLPTPALPHRPEGSARLREESRRGSRLQGPERCASPGPAAPPPRASGPLSIKGSHNTPCLTGLL